MSPLATTEVFDPVTGTFASSGRMSSARSGHSGTVLPSGKVLVAAGNTAGGYTAEIYNPVSGAFGAPLTMLPGMGRSVGVLLTNGKVLLAGINASAQLFDEATSTFSSAGSPTKNPELRMKLMALPQGRAVLDHGLAVKGCSVEFFDPITNRFGGLKTISEGLVHSATSVLPNGAVLMTGGYSLFAHELSLLYDPATGTSVVSGNMTLGRYDHTSTLLHNGKVLIAGGTVKLNGARGVELYDWKTGKFSGTSSLALPHPAPSVTLLTSGKVLLIDPERTAEIYEPARLAAESCTANADCESGFCVDGVCCDSGCSGECQACNLPGLVGTCSPVAGAPHAPRRACDGSGTCAGTCDGKERSCTYPGPPTLCGATCASNKQTTSRCNGEGKCIEANATSCNNTVCADERTCKTTCATNVDCLAGFVCNAGACVVGTTCVDDHTVQPVAGRAQDCSPYKCAAGCLTSCKSVDDCTAPNVCSVGGECIPAAAESGSGCGASGRSASNEGASWVPMGLALLAGFFARARRRAQVTV